MRGDAGARGGGRGAGARHALTAAAKRARAAASQLRAGTLLSARTLVPALVFAHAPALVPAIVPAPVLGAPGTEQARPVRAAPLRLDRGRFTVVAYPRDSLLAISLLARATAEDRFPGVNVPRERVLIAVAPDRARFREWVGPDAPKWGAAVALPEESRVVVQGSRAGSEAGNPLQVLRHELAHLALHEALGDLAPRWFDEGYASYAAGEVRRDETLATNVSLLLRGAPSLDSLDAAFTAGATEATGGYALARLAVADLAALDPARGLTLFLREWRARGSLDAAVRAAYGLTLADFETRWRARVRRRYGALALVANVSVGAGLVALLTVPLYVVRRRRDRARIAAMRAAEARAERQAAALDAMLGPGDGAGDGAGDAADEGQDPR